MSIPVLVLNAGSSSLKFAVFNMQTQTLLLEGLAECLYQHDAQITIKHITEKGDDKATLVIPNASHKEAIEALMNDLGEAFHPSFVGHRVVHGGEYFHEAICINADVKGKIQACAELAPLHNPANLEGIEAAEQSFPNTKQYAIFDTGFHGSLPEVAYLYALPKKLYEQFGIRRYGFHGTSHHYVSLQTAKLMQRPITDLNMVVAHLGNGCSATAIARGKSLDTTMGFTPLDGLVMGTRSGSLDPSIIPFLYEHSGLSMNDIESMLNKESGLLGLSELSNDMRTLEQAMKDGHKGAKLAIEVFCFRLAKSIASLVVSLPSFDALVFTGGIGENSDFIRSKTCELLNVLGVQLDNSLNQSVKNKADKVSSSDSSVEVWVVATNEELMIAQQAFSLYQDEYKVGLNK
ncbi:MAG: acetate kinase [Sinobacterium sp.]|nr:acetate kinase [Sinobacterium sp.]